MASALMTFLHYIFSIIQLETIVFYFYFNQKFEFITKKTNKIGLIRTTVMKF